MDPSSLKDLFFGDDDDYMTADTLVATRLPPTGCNATTSAVVKQFIETSTGTVTNRDNFEHQRPHRAKKQENLKDVQP
jgi:hypothetical protein